jgi:heterodisulfide reductase subunit A-like polyferredoxin
MEKHNLSILIDYTTCSPSSGRICIGVCPYGILEKGTEDNPKIVEEACTRCGICTNLCLTKAIIINQTEFEKTKK